MGAKVTIPPIVNPESSSFPSSLNDAVTKLANEFDKVVYRDGSFDLDGNVDMASKRIFNLPAPTTLSEPLRLADLSAAEGIEININNDTTLRPDLASSTGVDLIGATSPKGGPTTLQRHIVRNYLEDISGFEEGETANAVTNATLLNAALLSGGHYYMRPGAFYKIGSRIDFQSGSGLIFEGTDKPTIYMPATNFNRATLDSGTRYGTNAVGLAAHGVTAGYNGAPVIGVTLANFILQSEVNGDRSITGISGRNAMDFVVDDVEMFGFPLGVGLSLHSVRGRSIMRNLNLHDFYSDTVIPALAAYAQAPNATAVSVGGDEIEASAGVRIGSDGILFENFKIDDIATGPNFISYNGGEQSDALNVSGQATINCKFNNFDIRNVAEGVDCFGAFNQFNNFYIENARYFGLKLIHGGSDNQFSNVRIKNAGIGGVTISGAAARDTARNTFTSIEVDGVDPNGVWAASDTFGVRIEGTGTYRPRNNTFFGLRINGGNSANYGWVDTSTGSENLAFDVTISDVTERRVLVTNGAGGVRERGSAGLATDVGPVAAREAHVLVPDEPYGAGWNNDNTAPTKNSLWNKIENLPNPNGALTPLSIASIGAIKSSSASAGIGYATGAGGSVTQVTSKSTAVTLNRMVGQITMHNASLPAGTSVAFIVNNTSVGGQDPIIAHVSGGVGNGADYRVEVVDVSTGAFVLKVSNVSAGALGEALRINFGIIKGVIN